MKHEPMKTLTISLSAQQQELSALELSRLKRAYDEGMASGEGRAVDAGSLLTDLEAERPG